MELRNNFPRVKLEVIDQLAGLLFTTGYTFFCFQLKMDFILIDDNLFRSIFSYSYLNDLLKMV